GEDLCARAGWRGDSGVAVVAEGQARDGEESDLGIWVWVVWVLAANWVQQHAAEPAGSRDGAGVCPCARRRRYGETVARCRAVDAQEKYLHGLYCSDGASGGAGILRGGSGGGGGAQRGRTADGRDREYASGSVPGDCVGGPVCGRDEHDAGSNAAADGSGVRGVGRSTRERSIRIHAELF